MSKRAGPRASEIDQQEARGSARAKRDRETSNGARPPALASQRWIVMTRAPRVGRQNFTLGGVPVSLFDWSTPIPNFFWEVYDRWIAPSVTQALQVDLHERMINQVAKGGRLLDVGSGGGQHAVRVVQERPDLRVTG